MVQFASYLRRVLCKTRLIFPRINGRIVSDSESEVELDLKTIEKFFRLGKFIRLRSAYY